MTPLINCPNCHQKLNYSSNTYSSYYDGLYQSDDCCDLTFFQYVQNNIVVRHVFSIHNLFVRVNYNTYNKEDDSKLLSNNTIKIVSKFTEIIIPIFILDFNDFNQLIEKLTLYIKLS
jgi:hypothetical protein